MRVFGTATTGEDVHALTLTAGELTVTLLTWGAALQDVRLAGVDRSLTLGSENLADYEGDMRHHGTLIGPIANRISTARVRIDGMDYELERNQDGRIHLHSGRHATHRRLWQVADHGPDHATLTCDLGDGACGLPGNRQITARFQVAAPATLTLDITGTTDAPTLMNFANHSYWNFDGSPTWAGHRLQVHADRYLPGTPDLHPTGEIARVEGTEMDFRQPREIVPNDPWIDNNFCLSDQPEPLRDATTLTGITGVGVTVATNQPGVQIYDGREAIRPGRGTHEGIAIEAQNWPDAPTHKGFPSIRVTPDAPYRQRTSWRFHRS